MSKLYCLSFLCCFLSVLILTSCEEDEPLPIEEANPSILMHNSSGTIYFSYLDQVPPGRVSDSKSLYTFTAPWTFRALSISPTGKYGALAIFSTQGNSRQWEGRIRIYDTQDGNQLKEYDKAKMVSIMNFPVADASMVVERLGWMKEEELLVHLQPQTPWIGSVPQNVSLIINVSTDARVDIQYSERTAPFAIQVPAHAAKQAYTTEVIQNRLHIEGNAVADLPEVGAYDIYFGDN